MELKFSLSAVKRYAVAICLVVVACNTMTQLWLEQGMATKSKQLDKILADSGDVTAQSNDQLLVLKQLKQQGDMLGDKMNQLHSGSTKTADRLQNLDQITAGILKAANAINGNTKLGADELGQIKQLVLELEKAQADAVNLNNSVINHLQKMEQLQTAAVNDLKQMNTKTNMLPH